MTSLKRKKRPNFLNRLFNVSLSSSLIVLFVLQVAAANGLSSKGREINELTAELTALGREESRLTNSLADLGSLERVREEALNRVGMVDGHDNFDYLVPPKMAFNR